MSDGTVKPFDLSKLTPEVVELFAPEHTQLRYQNRVICADNDRKGGMFAAVESKEWRCKRCFLLDLIEEHEFLDENPPRLVLDIYDWGNVR